MSRVRRSGVVLLSLAPAALLALSSGGVLARSPDPSITPASVLPSTLTGPEASPALEIRWTGDGESQPGRGRMPFTLFGSGSQLDDAAAGLGLDLATMLGDRGLVRGADPDTVYAIDAIIDPAIEPLAWNGWFTGPQRPFGWDLIETAAGPVIINWGTGPVFFFHHVSDGLAVEVAALDPITEEEIVAFIEQLPPNGIPKVDDPLAIERGRRLAAWDRPSTMEWTGNVFRRDGLPIGPRAFGDLFTEDGFEVTDLGLGACGEWREMLGFSGRRTSLRGATGSLRIIEWLDPTGDGRRWMPPLRAAMEGLRGLDGKPYRELRQRPLKDRPGFLFIPVRR